MPPDVLVASSGNSVVGTTEISVFCFVVYLCSPTPSNVTTNKIYSSVAEDFLEKSLPILYIGKKGGKL